MHFHCQNMTHVVCSKLNSTKILNSHILELNSTKILNSHILANVTRSKCYFKELPFSNLQDINQIKRKNKISPIQISHSNTHAIKLREYEKHMSFCTP